MEGKARARCGSRCRRRQRIRDRSRSRTTFEEPKNLLVQARGEPSPLYAPEGPGAYEDLGAFARNIPLDDDRLVLPTDLAAVLPPWSSTRPPGDFASRSDLRRQPLRS